ncbi:MAG TPA: NAD(P)/FAD-dependent oxidoreductase [Phycisphaerales bacterium]|nr:NAD(P)/FAD-dependent oxidoreductase [Phycisphaerales bacterium]
MVVGEFTQEAELVVIGGGPGGYSAAFRAAELGIQTILIDERDQLGGVCLHEGCIPSKTLLHIAEIIRIGEGTARFGVKFAQPSIDVQAINGWVVKTRETLAKGLAGIAKKHRVEVIRGRAVFEDSRMLSVRDGASPGRVRFKRALIACGSCSIAHPAMSFDGVRVLTPREAVHLESVPQRLLIVGHNYMSLELATIYSALGSQVTLVDECERLLPEADQDLVRPLMERLKTRLTHIGCQVIIKKSKIVGNTIEVEFQGEAAPKDRVFDRAIVAIGQRANTDGLGLERTGVRQDELGFIQIDAQGRTTDPRIFAVGDVTGGPLLADHAMMQGRVAAEVIAGWNSTQDRRGVAWVAFTDPQLAWCGITEAQAQADDIPYRVAKLPWGASGRAVGIGRSDGLTKILYDPDSRIVLGVGISGVGAVEMIAEGVLAIEMGAVVDDLAGTIRPHPTLSELIADAAQRAEESHGRTSA